MPKRKHYAFYKRCQEAKKNKASNIIEPNVDQNITDQNTNEMNIIPGITERLYFLLFNLFIVLY